MSKVVWTVVAMIVTCVGVIFSMNKRRPQPCTQAPATAASFAELRQQPEATRPDAAAVDAWMMLRKSQTEVGV